MRRGKINRRRCRGIDCRGATRGDVMGRGGAAGGGASSGRLVCNGTADRGIAGEVGAAVSADGEAGGSRGV